MIKKHYIRLNKQLRSFLLLLKFTLIGLNKKLFRHLINDLFKSDFQKVKMHSADFEESTITVKVDDAFWENHVVGNGNTFIYIGDGIQVK